MLLIVGLVLLSFVGLVAFRFWWLGVWFGFWFAWCLLICAAFGAVS